MSDLEQFEVWLQEQDRSPVTVRGYMADLRAFAAWFEQTNGKALGVEEVTPADVREYRGWLQAVKRAGAATVRRHLMALRAYCRWGVETERIDRDPTARVKLPREETLSPGWLAKQEQYRLLREAERAVSAADTPTRRRLAVRDRALVVFLLNTGLRIAEACALTVEDVQIGERSGWVVVRGGKGNKSRKVPLNVEVRRALNAWREERGDGEGSVFDLTPSGAYRRLVEMGRRAGVEVHPHTLRHTLAKNLVDAGVGLHEVAALLGHSSLNTTRVYVTPGERDLERALQVLEG
ncbi:tyrosine-type recombinase/integrase [Anaerolinea thermophila]|uniref:Site-specific recombinase n=1 Tax=Anaerolinea thermophila (strain DSM 14523 / JCM 11388 / NBRC 100420 / UNI-1) TaxID=926569 RepID=E8MYW8_ANATU|nr:tyrosine-type recombinase/integrase [Anaerolinea thermophila]BAJ64454.1 putative site-specific recombinase [Anaerolinea thermophila UNI-1]